MAGYSTRGGSVATESRLQCGPSLGSAGVALVGSTFEHAMNHPRQFRTHIGSDLIEVGGVALQSSQGGLGVVLAGERNFSGQTFVENETE